MSQTLELGLTPLIKGGDFFTVESWLEHLRQHERVTNADRVLQEDIAHFQIQGAPKVTYLIAPKE